MHELAAVVGAGNVLTAADERAAYEIDWTGRFVGRSVAVVRPADTAEVAAALAVCNRAGVGVVPQGGNTGLVGGAVPEAGQVVLSLRRLTGVGPVDVPARTLWADAGATLGAVQRAAAEVGLRYAVDFAARDSATIGGTVATNAGGVGVLRHGGTRAQLLGVEAVLADGTVVSHLHALAKDNTGYDLATLVCGSEGTLAVVTRVALRLATAPPARVVALVGFTDLPSAVDASVRWRGALEGIEALELIDGAGLALVRAVEALPDPGLGDPGAVVLLEVSGVEPPTEQVAVVVGATPGVTGSAFATAGADCARLWRYREGQTTSIASLGPPHKFDVSLPAGVLATFPATITAAVREAAPSAQVWCFGHLGDGNLHLNVTGVAPDDASLDDLVLRRVAAAGGSISAEHGIGRAKQPWLGLARTPAEIATFRRIKAALDPRGTLNPGVLLPPG